jgi:hypothetical protein
MALGLDDVCSSYGEWWVVGGSLAIASRPVDVRRSRNTRLSRHNFMKVDFMMLFLLLFFAMITCTCSPCDGFRNDKACQLRALRGKEKWEANKKSYKFKAVLKHKKRYYIARGESRLIVDNISDEESK